MFSVFSTFKAALRAYFGRFCQNLLFLPVKIIIYLLVDKVELYTPAEGWYSPEEDVYFSEALAEEKLSSDGEYHPSRGYKARLSLVDT